MPDRHQSEWVIGFDQIMHRYYGRTDEVLARIEAGGERDAEVDLRGRRLELFKVVTKDGIPEVWLMGRRLLELRD